MPALESNPLRSWLSVRSFSSCPSGNRVLAVVIKPPRKVKIRLVFSREKLLRLFSFKCDTRSFR
jgi:hypothetical protein